MSVIEDKLNLILNILKSDKNTSNEFFDFINKIGQRVKVIDGFFSGVEGVVKRINKNKRVVVQLEGLAAVAIAFVPASQLSLIKTSNN